MELDKNHGYTNAEIIAMVLEDSTAKDPWYQTHMSRADTSKVWTRLDEIYNWYLENTDVPDRHLYRKACHDFELDDGYKNQHATWKLAIKWIQEFGNPHEHGRWQRWMLWLGTDEYSTSSVRLTYEITTG